MKKSGARLSLSRESLRQLDVVALDQAAGGQVATAGCTASLYNSCDPISVRICPTHSRVTC